eukprot:7562156-Pyramimonas_sp.AAC.1
MGSVESDIAPPSPPRAIASSPDGANLCHVHSGCCRRAAARARTLGLALARGARRNAWRRNLNFLRARRTSSE